MREPITDTRLVYDVESSPVLMPLLLNEVLPRDGENLIRFEPFVPTIYDARIYVPTLAPDTGAEIDGGLDEAFWQELGDGHTGRPEAHAPRLRAANTGDALLLAFSAEIVPAEPLVFGLAFLPLLHIPAGDSPYLRLRMDDGETEALWVGEGGPRPLLDPVEAVSRREGSVWQAELRLPYASLPEAPLIGRDTVFRLNARLFTAGGLETTPIAQWGWPVIDAVQYGALLFFNPARVEATAWN